MEDGLNSCYCAASLPTFIVEIRDIETFQWRRQNRTYLYTIALPSWSTALYMAVYAVSIKMNWRHR